MLIIYLDNFRGFKDSFVPLYNVNFLVGENSTGKTSFLNLFNLLTTPNFWFNQLFNTENIEFGSFKDIVSIESEDKTKFKIGVFESYSINKQEQILSSFLLTFINNNSLPIIQKYNFMNNENEFRIIFHNKSIEYKIIPKKFQEINCDPIDIFNKWIYENEKQEGFKRIDQKEIPFSRSLLLGYVISFLERREGLGISQSPIKLPSFAAGFSSNGPIRTKPKRTYDEINSTFSAEGEHIPYILKRILNKKDQKTEDSISLIEEFGRNSGLFDKIKIKKYGKSFDSPFSIDLLIDKKELNIINTGYGISQSLPIVVDSIARNDSFWFAIQQPEIHLHPKAQAALGDLFFQLAENDKKMFIIETHSDYIIDRFRLKIMEGKGNLNIESQVLFFEKDINGNHVTSININNQGEYSKEQPKSFREFFIKEQRRLLGL